MKKILTTLILLLINFVLQANDGAYRTKGSIIYPMQETKISMDKEVLSFTVRDKIAYVDIDFEFYNPENESRKLLVGFQAPSASGDVDISQFGPDQIKDFTIVHNGDTLSYKMMSALGEDSELYEVNELEFSPFVHGIYVFLFEIEFQAGINKIHHTYNFAASDNIYWSETYSYILTTGSKWAGGIIKDFTLNIDMGENKYFAVDDIFGENAEWKIIGKGRIPGIMNIGRSDSSKMVRILEGELQIKTTNFVPSKNIWFSVFNSLYKQHFDEKATFYADTTRIAMMYRSNKTNEYFRKAFEEMKWRIHGQEFQFGSPPISVVSDPTKIDTIFFKNNNETPWDTLICNIAYPEEYKFEYNECCNSFYLYYETLKTERLKKEIVINTINSTKKKYIVAIDNAAFKLENEVEDSVTAARACRSAMSPPIYNLSVFEYEDCENNTEDCNWPISCLFESNSPTFDPYYYGVESNFNIVSEKHSFKYIDLSGYLYIDYNADTDEIVVR